jgi:hypothetical protein
MKTRTLTALSSAGLFVAAAAWSLHQQADYILASLACANGNLTMSVVTALALLAMAGAGIATWMVIRRDAARGEGEVQRPRRFLISVSLLALLLFLFAIFLQASAPLFLPSCV